MASFKYGFQKIVDLKESEKTQTEWLLSDAIAILNEENELLRQIKQQQQEWEQKLEQAVLEASPLADVITINEYIEYLEQKIKSKLKDIKRAEHKVELRRNELAHKMKEEKVWHKAKEHAFAKFQYNMLLKEQQELDEMASIRFMSPAP